MTDKIISMKTIEILEERISEEEMERCKNLNLDKPKARLVSVPFVLTNAFNIESYKGSLNEHSELEPYTMIKTYEGSVHCLGIPFDEFDKWFIQITAATEIDDPEEITNDKQL